MVLTWVRLSTLGCRTWGCGLAMLMTADLTLTVYLLLLSMTGICVLNLVCIRVVSAGSMRLKWPVDGVVSFCLKVVSMVRVIGRLGDCSLMALRLLAMRLEMAGVCCIISASGFG